MCTTLSLKCRMKNLGLHKKCSICRKKDIELYDNAPSGCFTLSKIGDIEAVNLFGTEMLGKESKQLISNPFSIFVSEDTPAIFNIFF